MSFSPPARLACSTRLIFPDFCFWCPAEEFEFQMSLLGSFMPAYCTSALCYEQCCFLVIRHSTLKPIWRNAYAYRHPTGGRRRLIALVRVELRNNSFKIKSVLLQSLQMGRCKWFLYTVMIALSFAFIDSLTHLTFTFRPAHILVLRNTAFIYAETVYI
jgi:hypothetical protein